MRSLIRLWPSSSRVIRLSVGVSLLPTLVRLTRSHQRSYRKSLFEAGRAVCWPSSSQKKLPRVTAFENRASRKGKISRTIFRFFFALLLTISFPVTTRIVKLIERKIGRREKKVKLEFSCRRNMIFPGLFQWIASTRIWFERTLSPHQFGVKVFCEHLNWWHNKWGKGQGAWWHVGNNRQLKCESIIYYTCHNTNQDRVGYSSFWFTNLWSFDQTDPMQDWGLSWDETFTNRLDCNKSTRFCIDKFVSSILISYVLIPQFTGHWANSSCVLGN